MGSRYLYSKGSFYVKAAMYCSDLNSAVIGERLGTLVRRMDEALNAGIEEVKS